MYTGSCYRNVWDWWFSMKAVRVFFKYNYFPYSGFWVRECECMLMLLLSFNAKNKLNKKKIKEKITAKNEKRKTTNCVFVYISITSPRHMNSNKTEGKKSKRSNEQQNSIKRNKTERKYIMQLRKCGILFKVLLVFILFVYTTTIISTTAFYTVTNRLF